MALKKRAESISWSDLGPDICIRMSSFFSALSDSSRVRILLLLSKGPTTVNTISSQLSMEVSAVSHQLKLLRSLDLVRFEKRGRERLYSIADHHVLDILCLGRDHVYERGRCSHDLDCSTCRKGMARKDR